MKNYINTFPPHEDIPLKPTGDLPDFRQGNFWFIEYAYHGDPTIVQLECWEPGAPVTMELLGDRESWREGEFSSDYMIIGPIEVPHFIKSWRKLKEEQRGVENDETGIWGNIVRTYNNGEILLNEVENDMGNYIHILWEKEDKNIILSTNNGGDIHNYIRNNNLIRDKDLVL